jgi:TolB-like protein/cytochrome c-type biogenesis protein CcmH/NrfG
MKILSELRRRNVLRMGALYLGGAWLVMQVVDILIDRGPLPESLGPLTLTLLAIGFPIALILSWFYEVTPEGVTLDEEVQPGTAVSAARRRLDVILIAVLAAAVLMFAFDKWWTGPPPERSVAVLPFVSMSTDDEIHYLGAGVADTILNVLVTIPNLHVASRTSSFQPRLDGLSVPEVAALLGVTTILEGSVQRQGDRLRITAQLVDAENDNHLWSSNFDREYGDIFAVQDEIAEAVASALEIAVGEDARLRIDREGTDNRAALEAYSRAIANLRARTTDSVAQAVEQLKRAVELDPEYARAHAMLGHIYGDWRYAVWSELTRAERRELARDAANTALRIAPGMSTALALLGQLTEDGDARAQLYREAVAKGPNDTVALRVYTDYLFDHGQTDEAMGLAEKLIRLDPLDETNYTLLAGHQQGQFRIAEALETIARGKEKVPNSVPLRDLEHICFSILGDFSSAIRAKHETLTTDPKEYQNRWLIAQDYFNVGMPEEADRWWERAAETAPERDQDVFRLMLRTTLDVYHQRDDEATFESLQRWVTEAGERFGFPGAPGYVHDIFIEYGDRLDRLDEVLSTFEDLAPQLFADPPDVERYSLLAPFAGLALMRAGDQKRGEPLLRPLLELQEKDPDRGSIMGYVYVLLYLGDTDAALEHFRFFAASKFVYVGLRQRFIMQYSPVWAPIRAMPEYAALMQKLDQNAAEQRRKLQAMDLPLR